MTVLASFPSAPDGLVAHAPVLMALAPIIGACAAALAPNGRWAWAVSLAASLFAAWMAVLVAGEVEREGAIIYALGGFQAPYGIAFRVDAAGSLVCLLVATIGVLAAIYSGSSLKAEIAPQKQPLFQAGFLLCLGGLLGMAATGDAFNAFVFLEISSIGTYALVAVGANRDRRALTAAFNYLIMGTIGATFFVIGVGFLYAATGTLNLLDMADRLQGRDDLRSVQAGLALVIAGLGLKAALFPLHGWLPGAYAHGPSLMSVFLSATATKVSLYLLCRFLFDVFDPQSELLRSALRNVVGPLGALGAIICSLQAIYQTDVRRILAFSSVAQVGMLMMAVASGSTLGLAAMFLHIIAHSMMKATLFMTIGGVSQRQRVVVLADLAGFGRRAPWSMTAFAIAASSLAGIPFTLGFISKWRLTESLWASGDYWLLATLALASLLSILYVGRLLDAIFFHEPAVPALPRYRMANGVLIPAWTLAFATIWFGVDTRFLQDLSAAAAIALMGAP